MSRTHDTTSAWRSCSARNRQEHEHEHHFNLLRLPRMRAPAIVTSMLFLQAYKRLHHAVVMRVLKFVGFYGAATVS